MLHAHHSSPPPHVLLSFANNPHLIPHTRYTSFYNVSYRISPDVPRSSQSAPPHPRSIDPLARTHVAQSHFFWPPSPCARWSAYGGLVPQFRMVPCMLAPIFHLILEPALPSPCGLQNGYHGLNCGFCRLLVIILEFLSMHSPSCRTFPMLWAVCCFFRVPD